MSFWEQDQWTPQSRGSIESILKSDEPTLVKLLDDDELISEVSNLHDGLLLFLSRPDIVEELLGWMLGEEFEISDVEERLDKGPDFEQSDGPDMDEIVDFSEFDPPTSEKMQYKFPHSAYQILQCGVGLLLDLLVKDYLPQFFKFLHSPKLQERTYCFYWFQTFQVMCQRNGTAVFEFLRQDSKYIDILISNLDNQTISDLLLYISCEDTMDILTNDLLVFRQWLHGENDFTRKIVSGLDVKSSRQMQNAVGKFISDSLDRCGGFKSQFITDLGSQEIAEVLIQCCIQPERNLPALNVVRELLNFDPTVYDDGSDAMTPDPTAFDKSEIVEAVRRNLSNFQHILKTVPDSQIDLPAYSLTPPLSRQRLKVIQIILGVIGNELTDAYFQDLKECGIIPTCINLFFDYPLNNILHASVEKIIKFSLESFNETCYSILFEDANLLQQILTAWEANKQSKVRLGYAGHVIRIANTIEAIRHSEMTEEYIKALIESAYEQNQEFHVFVVSDLKEVNERLNTSLGERRTDIGLSTLSDGGEEQNQGDEWAAFGDDAFGDDVFGDVTSPEPLTNITQDQSFEDDFDGFGDDDIFDGATSFGASINTAVEIVDANEENADKEVGGGDTPDGEDTDFTFDDFDPFG